MEEPKITQTHGVFSMACCVSVNIRAKAERIWGLLTDAKDFSRWNSTITGVEGQIREGQPLRLRVPGTDRTFTPKVSGLGALRAHDLERRIRSSVQRRTHLITQTLQRWFDRFRDG